MNLRQLTLCAALCLVAVVLAVPVPTAGGFSLQSRVSYRLAADAWSAGELANLKLSPLGLALSGDASFVREGRCFGIYVSDVMPVEGYFDLVRASASIDATPSGQISLEARSSLDAVRWSPWTTVQANRAFATLPVGRFVQYRAELSASPGEAPVLRGLSLDLASTGAVPTAANAENPTVRVFGSREGLVGRRTANGHTIAERDRFVALPSRRALNPAGKQDYQVRLSYKGKTATAPVWDVGPWNTRDNYWDEQRELFGDLPRFVPQAFAAWQDNYNGGRDQFNRWVSFPASIDIADGAFLDDLGMRNSDWLDVTFLWLNAASPPKSEAPVVAGLKPEPKASGPAPEGQTWYFAEGSTRPPFETWFLLYNPNSEPAKAYLNYWKTDGSTHRQEVTLNGSSRLQVYANQAVTNVEFATRVEATRPIFVERAMYFGQDGHSAAGVTTPATTWYLAEGVSQPPFETWILLQNPGSSATAVTLSFMKESGQEQAFTLSLAPSSRYSLYANEIIPNSAFSTRITSEQPIVAERSVYLANGGGHATAGSAVTSKTWYLAEGSTQDGFDSWLLIQNPGASRASLKISYLREQGDPVEQRVVVKATSRSAVNVRELLSGERFGVKVEADQEIVVERATYFGGAADGRGTGAHASVGAPQVARTWYLAEGSTQPPFVEQVLLANPGREPARVRIDFIRGDSSVESREYELGALRRLTVDVNAEVPNAALSARVSSDQPIVVERSSYFNGGSGGTNSLGIPRD